MRRSEKILSKLLLPGFFVVLIGGAYWLSKNSNSNLSSLGSSLVAEFLGAAVAVFGVDYLIRRREENNLLPVRASSYEDVRLLATWALDLWRNAYNGSVNDSAPCSWEQLLSEESVNKVLVSLDITKPANILPPMPWGSYIDHELDRIHGHAEKILERHGFILMPEVQNAVYNIVYYGGSTYRVMNIRRIDQQERVPRPTNLGSGFLLTRQWFDAALLLHRWLVSAHKKLIHNGFSHVHAPPEFLPLLRDRQLPASIELSKLQEQVQEFKAWQRRKRPESHDNQ